MMNTILAVSAEDVTTIFGGVANTPAMF